MVPALHEACSGFVLADVTLGPAGLIALDSTVVSALDGETASSLRCTLRVPLMFLQMSHEDLQD